MMRYNFFSLTFVITIGINFLNAQTPPIPQDYPKAVVIVLEAPILINPDLHSQVLERKRKGDTISIHRGELHASPYRFHYQDNDMNAMTRDLVGDENNLEGFYKVPTKNGGEGFILKKYVKMIYKDSREFTSKINRFKHDPTDYRLEEPLPDRYPLYDPNHQRALITFGMGSTFKNNYAYPTPIDHEEYSMRFGMNLMYLKNVSIDQYNRFYFGGMIHAYTDYVSLYLKGDGNGADEKRSLIGLGPAVSYDIWRRKNYRFSTIGTLPVNFNRVIIRQTDNNYFFEERIFSGISITPKISHLFQIRDIVPKVDLVLGAEIQFQIGHTLTNKSNIAIPGFWNNDNDKITYPSGATYAFLIGIQAYH